jgi:quinol-cytochrome oxidoreductase complex cytochrome b subunit
MQRITQASFCSVITKLFVAAIALAPLAFVVAEAVGDQVPPYEPSLLNGLAWHVFMVSGAVAIVLGLVLAAWEIRDSRQR